MFSVHMSVMISDIITHIIKFILDNTITVYFSINLVMIVNMTYNAYILSKQPNYIQI